jgi:hypothetical protein
VSGRCFLTAQVLGEVDIAGREHGLDAVMHTELAQYCRDMSLYGGFGDMEVVANLPLLA